MIKKRLYLLLFLSWIIISGLTAQEITNTLQVVGAYYPPNNEGYNRNGGLLPVDYTPVEKDEAASAVNTALDPGRSIGSVWGGAKMKVVLSHIRRYPFLRGGGAFFKDNSAVYKISGELSPVSINALASLSVTPIAFFTAQTGAAAGTGWTAGFNGLGRNLRGPGEESIQSEPFSGIVWRIWQSASLQFDLAALVPGTWNHVIGLASAKVEYKAFTGAGSNEAWQYEADSGENFNGFSYFGTYFLGYSMPLRFETVGILVETERRLGRNAERSPMAQDGWGSDFTKVTFGPMCNILLNEAASLALLLQFQNGIDYSDETAGYRYFAYRQAEGSYIEFHRLALQYTHRL